ncbi:hypothetical protein WJX75_000928 [Coccomyxa subellipsoidea]|uniref:Kinesin motor domain-containing protein n=1 Tax=Coccomyxa subellipsoidea TaxID=248742 RepID=A0ABR2Z0I1_9CHLO
MANANNEEGSAVALSETAFELPDPVEHEHRISELFPRNLGSLFSSTPELLRKRRRKTADGARLAVAGAHNAPELDLERMKVVVRIRPTCSKDVPRWSKENCIHALSTCSLAMAPPEESQGYKNGDRGQTYNFSRVFGDDTGQEQFFQASAQPMGTKTHPGVLPCSLSMVFEEVHACVEPLTVRVSHYEVYNENIFDLLDEPAPGALGPRPALKLKEDSMGRVFVAGLSEVAVASVEEAMEILKRSSRARQKAATALNYGSSRSHSIFSLAVFGPPDADDTASDAGGGGGASEAGLWGRLSFVDLAGSERAARTGNVGARLKESVAINSSLMTLGRCLEALRWNQQHRHAEPRLVPYRESKVTHLFRDVLHGWGQILLCVNVSPAARDYDETARVLRYAALATQIGTAARAEPPLRVLKAKSPNITKKRKLAADSVEAAKGKAAKRAGNAAAAGDDATHNGGDSAKDVSDDDEDASSDVLPLASASAARPRRSSHWAGDTSRTEELEDCVLELQAEVARLTEQLTAAEHRCVLVETEVREEVSNEMADLLRSMEASYKERLAAETLLIEKRFAREGGQPARRDDRRVAQTTAPAQQEHFGRLQAQLKEAQAAADKHCADVAALTAALAEKDAAAAEQMTVRRQMEEAAAQHAEAEEQLRQHLRVEMQERIIQLNANATMEREMLEEQLERARKDTVALKRKLDSRPPAPLNPALLRAAQATSGSGMKGGRGAAGTPHDIALARARAEAHACMTPGGTAASMPAASPVAFPVMTPAAAAIASPLGVRSQGRAAPAASTLAPVPATEPSNVATDLASRGVEETAPPRRMRRQTVAPGQPAAPEPPRASDAEKATLAGEHASVLQVPVQVEPVLAPRRTRRQTMAAGALAHMPANDGGVSAPAVAGKLVKRARRQTQAAPTSASAEMAAGGSTGEQAMPSIMEEDKAEAEPTSQGYGEAVVSASQTAKLPQTAEEPSKTGAGTIVSQSCAPVPARRTRRQTMAHVVPEASSGPASAGTDRQRELGRPEAAQAAAPQLPSITEDEPEDDAAESAPAAEPTSAAAAHEEAAVGPAMHGGVNKRQKAVEKKATAKISRPGSASDKENAPAARGRPQSGRRKGKRKLLPQKKAAAHTVEAFGQLSAMEDLPLRALATPVALRTRRGRQNKT